MIALNFVSSLWNRFWTQKPQDVPVVDEEASSPLSERAVEDLTSEVVKVPEQRPEPIKVPSPEPETRKFFRAKRTPLIVGQTPWQSPAVQIIPSSQEPDIVDVRLVEDGSAFSPNSPAKPAVQAPSPEAETRKFFRANRTPLIDGQIPRQRPAALIIPSSQEPDIVDVRPVEDGSASSPNSPAKPAASRAILRIKKSPTPPSKPSIPDPRQIQEQTLNEFREIFGAAAVDRILDEAPGKIFSPKEIKDLFVRLRRESPLGEQTRFFNELQRRFGGEARFYKPERQALLTAARRTEIEARLKFTQALRVLYDPRAVEAVLPRFRAKEITDTVFMSQVGKLHYALKAQDERIQKWRTDLGVKVPLDPNPLTREALQRQEEGTALQTLQAEMAPEDFNRLLELIGTDRYLLPLIANHPQGLVKFFEECAIETPSRRIQPDAVLLKRLDAARHLPLNTRLTIANQIFERMEQAKNFWTQVNARFQSSADEVIARCFSRYAQGLFPASEAVFGEIGTLVERQKTGKAIAAACQPLLLLDQTDGSNRPVDTDLMKEAVSLQLDFDRHLSLYEQLDLTACVGSLIETEIGFLEFLSTLTPEQRESFVPALDPKEAGIVKGLQEKAAAQGLSFEDALSTTLNEHRELLAAKREKFFALRDKIKDDVQQNRSSPQNDALSPNSYKAQLILALADFAGSGNDQKLKSLFATLGQEIGRLEHQEMAKLRLELFRQQVALEVFRVTENEDLVSGLLTAMQHEIRALQGQPDAEARIGKLEGQISTLTMELQRIQFDLNQERELSPFMSSFHVVPLGNVVFRGTVYNADTEKDEFINPDGKWAVVDLRHVPERQRAAIVQLLPPARLADILTGKRPYEAASFDFKDGQLVPRADKGGAVRVFFESPKVAFVNHEDRDFGQRSRLIRKSARTKNERGERWPKEEYGDYVRVKKEPLKKEETEWSKARMMTAAVDRQIVIQGARKMAEAALQGQIAPMVRDAQHLGEFYDAVYGSDIAKMEGSYGEDPIFNRAVHMFKTQTERLAQADRIRAPLIRADLAVGKKRSRETESLMQMAGVTSFYRSWIIDIIAMQDLAKANPAFRDRFNWFLSQMKTVTPFIFQFLNRFPEEFRQIEKIMADITRETGRFPEAAEVARRFGRTPAEIRELLRASLEGIQREIKIMKIAFKDLQVAESSARVQERRNQLLLQLFPNDAPLRAQIGNAIGRILNGLTKVTLALEELLKKNVTELSPLHDEVLEAYAGASEEVFHGELLRSQEKQKIMAQRNEEEAIAHYFPAPVKPASGLRVFLPPPPPPSDVEMVGFI